MGARLLAGGFGLLVCCFLLCDFGIIVLFVV